MLKKSVKIAQHHLNKCRSDSSNLKCKLTSWKQTRGGGKKWKRRKIDLGGSASLMPFNMNAGKK